MHTFTVGKPRFDVGEDNLWPTIEPDAEVTLPFATSDEATMASPSQIGLLFLHREAPVGKESSVFIPPTQPEYNTPVTEIFPVLAIRIFTAASRRSATERRPICIPASRVGPRLSALAAGLRCIEHPVHQPCPEGAPQRLSGCDLGR